MGVDNNANTAGKGSVVFFVQADGREVWRSDVLRGGDEPVEVALKLARAKELVLGVDDGGDGPPYDHADWAEARYTTLEDHTRFLDELDEGALATERGRFPFSFTYKGRSTNDFLPEWTSGLSVIENTADYVLTREVFPEPTGGLVMTWEVKRFKRFPAVDWVLYFESRTVETGLIEDIRVLDSAVGAPRPGEEPYLLYRTNGAPSTPEDFEFETLPVTVSEARKLVAKGGRSSNGDFPFFKLDMAGGSLVGAIGWSGQWDAHFSCPSQRVLKLDAGMELTHFKLVPGERVRSPRILLMHWAGDTWEANSAFRELLYQHYCAHREGKPPLPMLFCNTCFTRGGGWLNECNAENQISLIHAYAPLGLEALLTDAGWFTGGWPMGAGNWDARKDAYPDGMGPVAQAALDEGMIYGLWYEPERVMAGTTAHREHPEWLLKSQPGEESTYLLDFGLPEVQRYFFDIVADYMKLPGFRFYRQDFNMDPLPYWRHTDTEDRQGITEMKYVEGLYAYWEALRKAWPDVVMEECASGGRRIDLETLSRMDLHQKTDYWFNADVDQQSLWGTSQYLPNNLIVAHINNLTDYSFYSAMASSLCLGWIADAPDFDFARAKVLSDRYLRVRHLLVGAWYPLLPSSRDKLYWYASQYHREDLDEGLVLFARREQSPYTGVSLALRGLVPEATYEVRWENDGHTERFTGAALASGLEVKLTVPRSADMITYRKAN